MSCCKRLPRLDTEALAAGGTVILSLDEAVVAFTVRVVDATTYAPVAYTLGFDAADVFHFAAGEAYTEDRLSLADSIELRAGAAVAARVELVTWRDV